MSASAIIVAAGSGRRFGTDMPKQFAKLDAKPVLAYTIEKFEKCLLIDEIIVVAPREYCEYVEASIINAYSFNKVTAVVAGGDTRQDSAWRGIEVMSDTADIVVIHDGARPFVNPGTITMAVECAKREGACVFGVKAKNTIKRSDNDGYVADTLNRDGLYEIQTPQAFKRDIILEAFKKAAESKYEAGDDATLVEHIGIKVKILDGSYDNIKITTKEDLTFAGMLLGINVEKR